MAATQAIHAFGTLLQLDDGAGNYTTIAEVTDIKGPGLKLDMIEATHHESPSGWREFIGGLKDGGEITFTINYRPTHATHNNTAGVVSLLSGKTKRNYKVVYPDTTTWTLPGYVTNFEPGAPIDDKLSADVTLKVSGAPTLA